MNGCERGRLSNIKIGDGNFEVEYMPLSCVLFIKGRFVVLVFMSSSKSKILHSKMMQFPCASHMQMLFIRRFFSTLRKS